MSKLGQTLKDLAPGLIGGAVGAVSPQAGESLTNAIGMADAFKQRRRTQAIQDERLIRERGRADDYREDREFSLGERDRVSGLRDDAIEMAGGADTVGGMAAALAPANWASGQAASNRQDSKFLRGVMDEETFSMKRESINDPSNPEFGQRITAKVRDSDGNVSTRYLVPDHMQGSQRDPNSLTKKDRYRYNNDYKTALGDVRSVFRERGDIEGYRQGLRDRPAWDANITPQEIDLMGPVAYNVKVQEDWDYSNKAQSGLIDRERKMQAGMDDAINRALNAGAILGQSAEQTFAKIREITGLNIAPGYDPWSEDQGGGSNPIYQDGPSEGESVAQAFSTRPSE